MHLTNRIHVTIAVAVVLTTAAQIASAQNGTVDLPQVYVDTTYPTQTGATRTVCATGCAYTSLQAAIDAANRGDTITVDPSMGAIAGAITLRAGKTGSGWILIRSASTAFDPGGSLQPGVRARSTDAAQMAVIEGSTATPVRAIVTETGASYYWIVGFEIRPQASQTVSSVLVMLGDTTNVADADHIVIDRCFIHGIDSSTVDFRKGVALNGANMAVINSEVTGFRSNATDAQAIGGWNGTGPFKISNNYLEGQSETILFGGADPTPLSSLLVPSDIEISGNYLTRRSSWATVAQKNQIEIKNGRRVLIERNIVEYSYATGQDGHVMNFKANNDNGGQCNWCSAVDITVRNNLFRHIAAGFKLARINAPNGEFGDISITNNVFDDADALTFGGDGTTATILLENDPTNVIIQNNTFLNHNSSNSGSFLSFASGTNVTDLNFSQNLVRHNTYGVKGPNFASGWPSMTAYTTNATFQENGIAGCSLSSYTGNLCPTYANWEAQFVNYNGGNGGDYHLIANNIYATQWPGVAMGADIDAVNSAISCSTTGDCATVSTAGFWTFDDGSGTTAADSSGSGNNATVNGATWTTGIINGALSFNGSTDNVEVTTPTAALKPSSAFAISAWVKYTTTDTSGGEVASMGDSYALRVKSTGEVVTFFYNGSTWVSLTTSGAGTNNGAWHHLVGQYTGSTLEIYVDGTRLASASASGSITYTLGPSFFIGQNGNGDTTHNFNGAIDQVRVYDRGLSAAEITQLATEPPAAYWPFSEGTGTTTADSTGNGNTGTINGATWTTTGRVGDALDFSGVDQSVSVAAPGAGVKPANAFAVSAWVKYTSTDSSGGEILSMGDSYGVRVRPTGEVNAFFYNGTSWIGVTTSGAATNDGAWHHIVGQYDGAEVQIYVDGVLKAQSAVTGSISYTLGTGLFIGHHGNGSTSYDFDGTIDQVRVFGRARTADEIATLAAEGQ